MDNNDTSESVDKAALVLRPGLPTDSWNRLWRWLLTPSGDRAGGSVDRHFDVHHGNGHPVEAGGEDPVEKEKLSP